MHAHAAAARQQLFMRSCAHSAAPAGHWPHLGRRHHLRRLGASGGRLQAPRMGACWGRAGRNAGTAPWLQCVSARLQAAANRCACAAPPPCLQGKRDLNPLRSAYKCGHSQDISVQCGAPPRECSTCMRLGPPRTACVLPLQARPPLPASCCSGAAPGGRRRQLGPPGNQPGQRRVGHGARAPLSSCGFAAAGWRDGRVHVQGTHASALPQSLAALQVCNGRFTDLAAAVACRQMGKQAAGKAPGRVIPNTDQRFGVGEGPILMHYLECFGREAALESCRRMYFGWALGCDHRCGGQRAAGVACRARFDCSGGAAGAPCFAGWGAARLFAARA